MRKELAAKEHAISDLTAVVEERKSAMTYTPEYLGKGRGNTLGGQECKKRRIDTLDRVSRLCGGLSTGARNNYQLFREGYDRHGTKEHGASWPEIFLRERTSVLNDMGHNPSAFQCFVYNKLRKWPDTKSLTVPGT